MTIQKLIDEKESEIVLLYEVITHPAGFNVDLFGDLLYIRPHCDGYEVGWKEFLDNMECNFHRQFSPEEAKEAVVFFVDKRFELELGIDIENELMKQSEDLNES